MLGKPDDIWDHRAASLPDGAEASRSMIGTSAASYMKSGPLKTRPDMTMDDALDGTGAAMRRYAEDQYWKSIPLPSQRPFDKYQSPTTLDAATSGALRSLEVQGTVEGQVQNNVTLNLQPSKWWEGLEQKVDSLVKVVGSLGPNGPGSTGRSSPDTAAPKVGFGGAGSAPY